MKKLWIVLLFSLIIGCKETESALSNGDTAANGAQGPSGPSGPVGEKGDVGAQGEKGEAGSQGKAGALWLIDSDGEEIGILLLGGWSTYSVYDPKSGYFFSVSSAGKVASTQIYFEGFCTGKVYTNGGLVPDKTFLVGPNGTTYTYKSGSVVSFTPGSYFDSNDDSCHEWPYGALSGRLLSEINAPVSLDYAPPLRIENR